jgi:hypothetical protein
MLETITSLVKGKGFLTIFLSYVFLPRSKGGDASRDLGPPKDINIENLKNKE